MRLAAILCSILVLATGLIGCSGRVDEIPPVDDTPVLDCPGFVQASSGLPDRGEWRTRPAVGDVDGDGLDDFAAHPRKRDGAHVYRSDGLGAWIDDSAGLDFEGAIPCGIGTRLVDLNRDGNLDLVLGDHCSGIYIYRGDGGKTWTRADRGVPRNMKGFNDAAVGDLDGDGWHDIVAASAYTRGFLVLRGRPNGTWNIVDGTGLPEVGSAWQVVLHDLNGDGRLDVVAPYEPPTVPQRNAPPHTNVWIQQEDGRFVAASWESAPGRVFGVTVVPRAGRTVPDLIFAQLGAHSGLMRFESEDGTAWHPAGRIDEGWFDHHPGYTAVNTADVNDDGCADILSADGATGNVLLALGDCGTSWRACPADTLPLIGERAPGWGVNTGDFNADGRLDVVAAFARSKGRVEAWLQRSPLPGEAQGQGPEPSRVARGSGTTSDTP